MNFELLKALCEAPGVPGQEGPIRALVAAEMGPLVDELSVDVMGNVVGLKRGSGGPRVMLAAHMDEIGFIVKHIDDRGFLRLQPMGGWDPRNLVSQRVYVHGHRGNCFLGALMPGTKPIHMQTAEDANKGPRLEDLFVDLGMAAQDVKDEIELGDPVTLARTAEIVGANVMSKTLDARVAVFVMIEALRALGSHVCDVAAVATTQEEVGLRGATAAAHHLEPAIGIALDTTLANDFPGPGEAEQITRLGAGVAIKIMDSSLICDPRIVRHFRDIAQEHGINHQMEILPRGGTDAGGIQRSRGGVPSCTISVPSRYVHTVNEMAALADIEAAIQLVARFVEVAHSREYGFGL